MLYPFVDNGIIKLTYDRYNDSGPAAQVYVAYTQQGHEA